MLQASSLAPLRFHLDSSNLFGADLSHPRHKVAGVRETNGFRCQPNSRAACSMAM